MTIRTDRLEMVTAELAAQIDAIDPLPMLPPAIRTALDLLRRIGRVDLVTMGKAEVRALLTSLPSRASSDPARAEVVASWLAALLAWLRGETDDPPPDLDLS